MQAIIVLGDSTSHGGTVISASAFSSTHGKAWARVGDMVACPRCKGVFPIIQGDASMIDRGKAVAFDGCKVACGATLVSSQRFTLTEPSSGAAVASSHAAPDPFGPVGDGLVAGYHDEPADGALGFRGRFRVLNQSTGAPVDGAHVRVRSTDGQCVIGTTDTHGYTKWVARNSNDALVLELIQPS